jgi:predicted RNA-binding Zn ribbon-like protein
MASSGGPAQDGAYVFDLSGGRLCLDFVNTVSGSRARPTERLNSYQDLVSWGRQAGALGEREARHLQQAARRSPGDAARVLADAIGFREVLYRVFGAAASLRPPDPRDVDALNGVLSRALARQRIERQPGGFAWGWADDADALDRMLWPVARSAADLLVSPDLMRVRQCAGANCDWLFMDMSRNRSRRWCDMKGCGNREKARRYYERHRARAAGPGEGEGGRAPSGR